MVMATCGTFDYTFVVPNSSFGGKRQMQGMLREPIRGDQEASLGTYRSSRLSNTTGRSGSCSVESR